MTRATMNLADRKRWGFTLVEIAVVLIVIALITGLGMAATLGAMESARRVQTQNKLDRIETALMMFRDQYNRLPCPSEITLTNSSSVYGLEAANKGSCRGGSPEATDVSGNDGASPLGAWPLAVSGGVPARTLGLPDEFMFDGWGRRLTYVVDANATVGDAFSLIPPDANNCSLWVMDAAGSYRSGDDTRGGAIYVLISHGSNGHGAYVNGTNRITVGSSNTSEHANCRCDSAGQSASASDPPYFWQKEESEDPNDPHNSFDDIVRFKERWQLQNYDDYQKAGQYGEFQLAVGLPYPIGEYGNIGLYKRGCDGWIHSRNQTALIGAVSPPGNPGYYADAGRLVIPSQPRFGIPYQVAAESIPGGPSNLYKVMGMAMTPDNHHLVVYLQNDSVADFCYIFDLTTDETWASVPTMACGDFNENNRMAMSDSGYLAVGSTTDVQIFRESGGQFSWLTTLPTITQPKVLALSRNANYLMISNKNSYASVYGRTDDSTFSGFVNAFQPVTSGYANITAIAFSPDEELLAVAQSIGGTPTVRLWQIGAGSPRVAGGVSPFTSLPSLFPAAQPSTIAFSPDGQYLALGLSNPAGTGPSGHVEIYKISGTTFTLAEISVDGDYYVLDDGNGSNNIPTVMAFTPNSLELLVGSNECCAVVLTRINTLTFQQRVSPINPSLSFDTGGPAAMAVQH